VQYRPKNLRQILGGERDPTLVKLRGSFSVKQSHCLRDYLPGALFKRLVGRGRGFRASITSISESSVGKSSMGIVLLPSSFLMPGPDSSEELDPSAELDSSEEPESDNA